MAMLIFGVSMTRKSGVPLPLSQGSPFSNHATNHGTGNPVGDIGNRCIRLGISTASIRSLSWFMSCPDRDLCTARQTSSKAKRLRGIDQIVRELLVRTQLH